MTQKKEFTMEAISTLWLNNGKSGKYLSGVTDTQEKVVGFFNGKKKNPKEPDVRVNLRRGEDLEEYISLWVNQSKAGNTYYSGILSGSKKRVVGFINKKAQDDEKQPYLRIYKSEEQKPEGQPAIEGSEADEVVPF